jgi:hypothetical protein
LEWLYDRIADRSPSGWARSLPPAHRYPAAESAASSMSWGSATPSPSASRPCRDHVEGMNCMGPTARSQVRSRSHRPASVSRMLAYGPPSRTGPYTAGTARCCLSRLRPAKEPDSTWPMAASSRGSRWQDEGIAAAAAVYALHNAAGTANDPANDQASATGPTGGAAGASATVGNGTANTCLIRSHPRSRCSASSYQRSESAGGAIRTWVVEAGCAPCALSKGGSTGTLATPMSATTASGRPRRGENNQRGEGRWMTRGAGEPSAWCMPFASLTPQLQPWLRLEGQGLHSTMPLVGTFGHPRKS